jgi:hypothetical protein
MLLVLLLGIADFGRVFQAGIAIESAARNAAEIGALERLRVPPPSDPALHDAYYRGLHETIAEVACEEALLLAPPDDHQAGTACDHLTAVRVCVADGLDPRCGDPIGEMDAPIPDSCGTVKSLDAGPWPNTSGGSVASHQVEVAICYQFSTLFNLDFALPLNAGLSLGDVYLERVRMFVVDCPVGDVSSC